MNKIENIGVSLSGGGIRATIFHLGVLKWMAENQLLENVAHISSVSGASLCVGLVYSHSDMRWPSSNEYLDHTLPRIKEVILSKDIEKLSIRKLIFAPYKINQKVNVIAGVMEKYWGVHGNLTDLQEYPIWDINCTTYETGKRFVFNREKMGDYKLGYVKNPNVPISDAMAASAGFPVLIGPYKMKFDDYKWTGASSKEEKEECIEGKYIHLWDGGVYDNLGMESVFTINGGGEPKKGIDYVIISNASGSIEYKKRKKDISGANLMRLLDISMDQVEALRTRSVVDYMRRTEDGIYLKIGNSASEISKNSKISDDLKNQMISQCLSDEDSDRVKNYPTTLAKPSSTDYEMILRHGYEVAKCTYMCYTK